MFRFSHTAIKNPNEQNGVVAVFSLTPETTPLATGFNVKAARNAQAKMSLVQLDFRLASSGNDDKADQLKLGRTAIRQHQRYMEHKMQAPATEMSNG